MGFREAMAEETREKATAEATAIVEKAAETGRRIIEDATNAADEILEERALLAEKTISAAAETASAQLDETHERLKTEAQLVKQWAEEASRREWQIKQAVNRMELGTLKVAVLCILTGAIAGGLAFLILAYRAGLT